MRKRSRFRYYIVAVLLVLLVVGICLEIFEPGTVGDVTPFIVSMISLLVAVLAFDISLRTYTSIDAVNSMTRMDGNIMENENYRTNLITLLKDFKYESIIESREAMMKKLTELFSSVTIVSGAKLADSIQQLIDYMIFFPYYVNASDEKFAEDSREAVDKLISVIETDVKVYDKMSEGSSVLLKENLKLIKAVFDVQLKRTDCSRCETVNVLEVRGSMMKNPVSRTLYHDYAGLFYLVKALDLVARHLGCSSRNEVYSISKIRELNTIRHDERCRITDYLDMAEAEFDKALKVIEGDIMWSAMIYFNKARVRFFSSAMNGQDSSVWKDYMNRAVIYRTKFKTYLLDVLPGYEKACLVRAFADEEIYARFTKIVFEMASGDSLTDESGKVLVPSGEYSGVMGIPFVRNFELAQKDDFKLLSAPFRQIVNYVS